MFTPVTNLALLPMGQALLQDRTAIVVTGHLVHVPWRSRRKPHQTVRKKWSPTKSTEDEFWVWNRCFPLRYRFHGCFGNKTLHGVTKRNWKDPWITKIGNHCQDAVRWFQSVPCDRSPEHVPWKGKRYLFARLPSSSHLWHYQNLYNLIISYISSKSTELQHHGFQRNYNNKIIQYDEREEVPPYCSFSMVSSCSPRWYGKGKSGGPCSCGSIKTCITKFPKGCWHNSCFPGTSKLNSRSSAEFAGTIGVHCSSCSFSMNE